MKKIILSLSLMVLVTIAWSQRPERPSAEQMIERATKDLSLTDEQVQQWTEIHEKYESDMKNESKARETMQVMGKELEATLTEEQLEKFKKMQKRQGPPRGEN